MRADPYREANRCLCCGQLIGGWVHVLWHDECRKRWEEVRWRERVTQSLAARGYKPVY